MLDTIGHKFIQELNDKLKKHLCISIGGLEKSEFVKVAGNKQNVISNATFNYSVA